MPMTGRISHQEILAWYEAWNRRDWDAIAAFLADDFMLDDVALGRLIRGPQDYLRYAQAWAEAFPDGKITVDHIAGSAPRGELVVVEYRGSGRQYGPWGVFPPSNRATTMRFCDLLRLKHDRIERLVTYTDLYRPLCELGHVVSQISVKKGEAA